MLALKEIGGGVHYFPLDHGSPQGPRVCPSVRQSVSNALFSEIGSLVFSDLLHVRSWPTLSFRLLMPCHRVVPLGTGHCTDFIHVWCMFVTS